jgi:hypothetical protein
VTLLLCRLCISLYPIPKVPLYVYDLTWGVSQHHENQGVRETRVAELHQPTVAPGTGIPGTATGEGSPAGPTVPGTAGYREPETRTETFAPSTGNGGLGEPVPDSGVGGTTVNVEVKHT